MAKQVVLGKYKHVQLFHIKAVEKTYHEGVALKSCNIHAKP